MAEEQVTREDKKTSCGFRTVAGALANVVSRVCIELLKHGTSPHRQNKVREL